MFECMLIGNGAHRNLLQLNFVEVRSTLYTLQNPLQYIQHTKQNNLATLLHTHFALHTICMWYLIQSRAALNVQFSSHSLVADLDRDGREVRVGPASHLPQSWHHKQCEGDH